MYVIYICIYYKSKFVYIVYIIFVYDLYIKPLCSLPGPKLFPYLYTAVNPSGLLSFPFIYFHIFAAYVYIHMLCIRLSYVYFKKAFWKPCNIVSLVCMHLLSRLWRFTHINPTLWFMPLGFRLWKDHHLFLSSLIDKHLGFSVLQILLSWPFCVSYYSWVSPDMLYNCWVMLLTLSSVFL